MTLWEEVEFTCDLLIGSVLVNMGWNVCCVRFSNQQSLARFCEPGSRTEHPVLVQVLRRQPRHQRCKEGCGGLLECTEGSQVCTGGSWDWPGHTGGSWGADGGLLETGNCEASWRARILGRGSVARAGTWKCNNRPPNIAFSEMQPHYLWRKVQPWSYTLPLGFEMHWAFDRGGLVGVGVG